jgi:EpsI family protein
VIARAAILSALILAGGAYSRNAGALDRRIPHVPLAQLPCEIDAWRCGRDVPLDSESLSVLRVDDYVNRSYVDRAGASAALFVGYYESQRQGDTIHSPQNCLPGSGWQPVSSSRVTLRDRDGELPANELIVEKNLDRQVVLYWYQGRGRAIASDYANKFWLVADAIRLHRSDGALVRIVAPDAAAAEAFARVIRPRLGAYLP